MEQTNKRPIVFIIVSSFFILILLTAIVLTVYYMRERLSLTPKAGFGGAGVVSIDNSYVFASPVRATAGGDLIRVTLFILDENGGGISDKKVNLVSETKGLVTKETQSVTDDTGKAFFDVSSDTKGTFYLNAQVDGLSLTQRTKLVFD